MTNKFGGTVFIRSVKGPVPQFMKSDFLKVYQTEQK